MIAIAKANNLEGEIINLGSNYEISIADLVHTIADIMQREVSISSEAQRLRPKDSEVERLWADNSKALDKLDWQPAYAGLEGLKNGLQHTVSWLQQSTNLQRYKADRYNV
jgi:dTDP-glucose 4,6-dehydratase